jgi:hypothetical protein
VVEHTDTRAAKLPAAVAPDAVAEATAGNTDLAAQFSDKKSSLETKSRQTAGEPGTGGTVESGKVEARYRPNESPASARGRAPVPTGEYGFNASRPVKDKVKAEGSTTLTAENLAYGFSIAGADAAPVVRAKPPLEAEANESAKTTSAGAQARAMFPQQGRSTLVVNGAVAQAMTLKPSGSWMIAGGVLQHSLDGGQNWQTSAQAAHPLLCYANRGQEVWAGGLAGTLLHSTDGGATWAAVSVAFEGGSLSSDITHIEVRGLSEIILSAGDHESWSSTDGGKTWEKN